MFENLECLIGIFKDGLIFLIYEDDIGNYYKFKLLILGINIFIGNFIIKKLLFYEFFIIVVILVFV